MAIDQDAPVTIGTSATIIFTAVALQTVVLQADTGNGAAVFIGGSAVTTANGYELLAGGALALNMQPGDTVYGISAAGSDDVRILHNQG